MYPTMSMFAKREDYDKAVEQERRRETPMIRSLPAEGVCAVPCVVGWDYGKQDKTTASIAIDLGSKTWIISVLEDDEAERFLDDLAASQVPIP